LTLLPSRRRA